MIKSKILKTSVLLILLFLILSFANAMAHPGGLDANGGHYNRKTGEYHYHKKTDTAIQPETKPTENVTVEVYFQPSELDRTISQMLMYLYLCACSYYILRSLYNCIDYRYLKYIFPMLSLFLLMCAFSIAGNFWRDKIYLVSIWLVFTIIISYRIYLIEKQNIKKTRNTPSEYQKSNIYK